jgi:putative ABC transport system ATP-binding protein
VSDTTTGKAIIELVDAHRYYEQGPITVKALDGVSVRVEQGEFSVLCGPSGSGKTTALNLIGALDAPTSGKVLIEGVDIGDLDRTARARLRRDRIGFVFQAYNLIPVLTAFENAEFVLELRGVPERERRDKVMGILAAVGLSGMEQRRPDELSGGQQQRVAIARAMASDPALILADEPTANLDSGTGEALLDVMQTLNREHGVTFLFSTHDERVMGRATRLIRMLDGKIVADERTPCS